MWFKPAQTMALIGCFTSILVGCVSTTGGNVKPTPNSMGPGTSLNQPNYQLNYNSQNASAAELTRQNLSLMAQQPSSGGYNPPWLSSDSNAVFAGGSTYHLDNDFYKSAVITPAIQSSLLLSNASPKRSVNSRHGYDGSLYNPTPKKETVNFLPSDFDKSSTAQGVQ